MLHSFLISVATLIDPNIHSVIKHADIANNGDDCATSDSFKQFSFDNLTAGGLLSGGETLESFIPCDYTDKLQVALGYATVINSEVSSFSELVVVPSSLEDRIIRVFGNGTMVDGKFLLDTFGNLSAQRLMSFINRYFSRESSGGRRLQQTKAGISGGRSEAVKRGGLIQALQNKSLKQPPFYNIRRLAGSEDGSGAIVFQVNDFLSFDFDFNFGSAKKELLFGAHFCFDSGDTATNAIQDLLGSFLNDTVGDNAQGDLGGFSFAGAAETLANSLVDSIVIGASADISVLFGLDLTNLFNSTLDLGTRIPSPYVSINRFELSGFLGVNEWSYRDRLPEPLEAFDFGVTEAKALVKISAEVPSGPVQISSPSDFFALIDPNAANPAISLKASLDVSLPTFVNVGGFGFGARIRYCDTDVLDDDRSNITIETDILIERKFI